MEQGRPVLYACTGCAANRSIDPDNWVPAGGWGFAPTRSFTIDVVDFHPSVDRVKALGGAVAFAAWICFGGPRVVIDSDETESGRGNVYPGSQADD